MTEQNDFTKFEHESWQRVAEKYENAWSGLTRLFIESMLDAANVSAGQRVLDIACGPGYVARAAAARDASVIGLDFSSVMVRLAKEANPDLEFRQGDAQALPFPAAQFDAVVMNFGLLHLAHPELALKESCRVLKPGGRFACTVWAPPEVSPGAKAIQTAVAKHANMDVQVPQGPDYFTYSSAVEARKAFSTAGFDPASLTFETRCFNWRVPTPSFVFEAEAEAGVRTAALLRQQTTAALSRIKEEIETSLQTFARTDHYAIPYAAYVIAATRL